MDLDNPGTVLSRSGQQILVPRVIGPVRRLYPVQVRDVRFLRANTDRKIKITVPGPFTMTQLTQDDFYKDEEALAFDLAAAVNEEIRDLFAAGADVVQIDEPYMQAYPEKARKYAIRALNRALEGLENEITAVHICFGYAALVPGRPPAYAFLTELNDCPVKQISIETAQSKLDCSILARIPDKEIILGVIDLSTHQVEASTAVAERIRRALDFVTPERLVIAPDCGMKYLPRDIAFGKMRAMVEGADLVRTELIA